MRPGVKLITRNLRQSKNITFINISGLTISFTCAFAISGWIYNELSYDRHFPDADRIYRLTFETTFSGNRLHFARCWESWVSLMPGDFPQIEELVRLQPYRHTALKINENKFYSDRVFATDSNFFKVFGVQLFPDDPTHVIDEPFTAVISSSVAARCFGKTDPVGKILLLSGDQDEKMTPYTIRGVMKDTPVNSHLHFDIITSFAKKNVPPDWAYVYLLLKKNSSPEDILDGLPLFIEKVKDTDDRNEYKPYLQNIKDIHLFSDKDREIEQNGNIKVIYLFAVIALIMLLISLINFYNLNKATLTSMHKQIYIQRVFGCGSSSIIGQSLLQSLISVMAAFLLTLMLLGLTVNQTGTISGHAMLQGGVGDLLKLWPLITLVLMISVASGSMPVLLYMLQLRRFIPISESRSPDPSSGRSMYGTFVTVQLMMSVILLISAITINRQKNLVFSTSLGEMNSDILAFKKLNWEIRSRYRTFRERALQIPFVKDFSASMEEPSGETLDALQVESPEIDETHKENPLYVISVEDNFLDFFNIPLVAGRNFPPFNPDRKGEDYILNETALKRLGWTAEESIGRPFRIKFSYPDIFYGGTVVGVVRDFTFTSAKQEIKPYVLFQKPIFYICFLVRIDPLHKAEAIESLKKIWDEEYPDYPFAYEFLDDLYRSSYSKEINQAGLTSFFSMFAIIIICMGLFSVTSVLVAKRTKEIGVRKVNGATTVEILSMLNSTFIRWFALAFLFACPIAWYIMNRWLQGFASRTELSWWIFFVSGAIVLAVTLFTVSLKSLKAARSNPVDTLRYE